MQVGKEILKLLSVRIVTNKWCKRSFFNGVPLSFFYINTAELILLQETGQGVIMFSITEWVILSGHYPIFPENESKQTEGYM